MPTIHLHGTLGGADALFFKPEVDQTALRDIRFLEQAAEGIKIVHEDSSPEYDKAHDWIQEAEFIHVLGFGYHPTNVRRLDIVSHKKEGVVLHGTACQLGRAEIDRAERDLQMGKTILYDVNCLEYLREHAQLE